MAPLTPLITPESLFERFPLTPQLIEGISKSRKISESIMRREDKRVVIFVGPCSIHNPQIAIEYAFKLKEISQKIADQIYLIMRVFLEKPRTQFGWKGFLYDPFLDGSYEVEKGVIASRKLLLKLAKMGIPIATEFLDPILLAYTQDIITWGVIGARTVTSPVHRQVASRLSMPIGFKNETNGYLDNAIRGALAARHPQLSLGIDNKGKLCSLKSFGNSSTHLILRGSIKHFNYDPISVSKAIQKQRLYRLNARLLVDCAHGNSQKIPNNNNAPFSLFLNRFKKGTPTSWE